MTVRDVYNRIDEFAPFATQVDYDRSGLQVGEWDAEVSGVLVAVDLSLAVIDEAVAAGCNLIVVHHPPIWLAMPTLCEGDYNQRMARRLVQNNLHCIAAHTNVDKCAGGNSESLVRLLGGEPTGCMESDEFAITFSMPPVAMSDLLQRVRRELRDPFAYAVGPDGIVSGGALCTGAGYTPRVMRECMAKGWVYLTGEVKHHDLREVQDMGGHLIVFGHWASERIFEDIMFNLLCAHCRCVVSRQDNPCH